MSTATQTRTRSSLQAIPSTMLAAVYHGRNDIRLETVPVPQIGHGELLIRVHTCGVCGTDLKKISTGSHSAPRIFGHETAGVIAAIGDGVPGRVSTAVSITHDAAEEANILWQDGG